ncbi:GNAT family N-acetyltransferase [Tessaracoccus caeni]|uniref:GNAT family N-acetyltransferase n=1 Tax=Tessaracoccus caeni TaxID=3031239 RepID=UPI0023DAB05B|nr:GNAT family N-acetyltransferase [Tessaracoccus caeni]MDF1490014.1 GNAT family N-acetyltransferase [Tessaracoccus caeni]
MTEPTEGRPIPAPGADAAPTIPAPAADVARPIPAPAADAARVSLRRRKPSGALADVVGHLVAANDEWLVVLPEDRGPAWVPRAEVQAIRRVPERIPLLVSPADAVQRVLDLTWPGLRRARLGGWVLRTGRGKTQRANSVLAVGDPGVPFAEACALAHEWAGERLPIQAALGSRVADEALAAGWEVASPTVAMVADARGLLGQPESTPPIADAPDTDWLRIFRAGDDDDERIAEMCAAPARYLRIGEHAVGRVAVARSWGVLSCIEVAPDARRQGQGRAVTRALAVEAVRLGARYLALQVEQDNTAARSLYVSEGYAEHHTYAYLRPPA